MYWQANSPHVAGSVSELCSEAMLKIVAVTATWQESKPQVKEAVDNKETMLAVMDSVENERAGLSTKGSRKG